MEQEILLVGAETPALHYALPFLRRAQFRITQVARAADAIALVRESRFDLVIARFPLTDLDIEVLIDALRDPAAACRRASLLVLAEPSAATRVGAFIGRGVNRVVSLDAHTEYLLEAIADLLAVAPRRRLRALVQLEAEVRQGAAVWLTATHNVSESGMLLQGMRELAVGSRVGFTLGLPTSEASVRGEAEVVRHTDPAIECVEGVGARFILLTPDSRTRLHALLDSSEDEPPPEATSRCE